MRHTLCISLGMLAIAGSLFAAPAPCVLDRTVALAPYAHAGTATVEEWRDSRLAIENLMDCPPAAIDAQSRRTFFDAVRSEFTTDHTAEIARWRKLHGRPHDTLDGAIGIFQTDLRRFMEKLVDRSDASSKDVVLRFGDGRAIAALGPSVKQNVISMLGSATRFYGINQRYHPQLDAIEALGYWIDPANREFSSHEKDDLTRMLISLLPNVRPGLNGYEDRCFQAALKALAHSDSIDAETALAGWMDRQNDHGNFLYHEASRSLNAIRAKRGHV